MRPTRLIPTDGIVKATADTSPLGYLMYPQGETANGRLDSLDPDSFKYSITVEEIR